MTGNLIMFSSFSSEPISILLVVYSTDINKSSAAENFRKKNERFSKKCSNEMTVEDLGGWWEAMEIYLGNKEFKEHSLKTERVLNQA